MTENQKDRAVEIGILVYMGIIAGFVILIATGCSSNKSSVVGPEPVVETTTTIDDFIVSSRSDAPTPSYFDGTILYFWSWIRVENGVGTFTPSYAYVKLERQANGWHLIRDNTWGTQRPGLYYEQDTMWAGLSLEIGSAAYSSPGIRRVYDLATCTLQFTEPQAASSMVLAERRLQHFNTWGDIEIIVLHETYWGEYYAFGKGLGLVGFHLEGQDWQWRDWHYVGPMPTPTGC